MQVSSNTSIVSHLVIVLSAIGLSIHDFLQLDCFTGNEDAVAGYIMAPRSLLADRLNHGITNKTMQCLHGHDLCSKYTWTVPATSKSHTLYI